MRRLMTKDEARLVLDAHLAFTNAGGDRSNEWYAGISADDMDEWEHESMEGEFPWPAAKWAQLRFESEDKGYTFDPAYNYDYDAPVERLSEMLGYDDMGDYLNASADDVTSRLKNYIRWNT